jgi:hypothetical protein
VREQVTKAIKHTPWYFSLLLVLLIAHRETAWKKIGQMYACCLEDKMIKWAVSGAGKTGLTNEAGVIAMAVMIAMESSREKRTNTAQFNTDSITVGGQQMHCMHDKREHFVGKLIPGRKIIKATDVMSGKYSGNGWTAMG